MGLIGIIYLAIRLALSNGYVLDKEISPECNQTLIPCNTRQFLAISFYLFSSRPDFADLAIPFGIGLIWVPFGFYSLWRRL